MNNLIKRLGQGIIVVGLSLSLFSWGNGLKADEYEYLKKIDKGLEGKVKVLKSERGRVVLGVGETYKIEIIEGVNNVHDNNVDVVAIYDKSKIIMVDQNIDFYPYKIGDYDLKKFIKKMSPEAQAVWNNIYNRIADKDSKEGFMIRYQEGNENK